MKSIFLLLTLSLLVFQTTFSQVKLLKDTLKKECRKDTNVPGKYIVEYTDLAEPFDLLPRPTGVDGKINGLVYGNLNSIERFNKIKQQIFTIEEMKYLAASNCYFESIFYSTGKIVSVTIIFYNCDPKVNIKKLTEFVKRIREEITFDLVYENKIGKHGYFSLSTKTFPEYMNSPR